MVSPWVKLVNFCFKGDDDLGGDFPCSTSVMDAAAAAPGHAPAAAPLLPT